MGAEKKCIFCNIAAGLAQACRVHETQECLAFLDTRPLLPGHVLLIPRAHYATLPEVPEELAARLVVEAQRLSCAVQQALGADGSFLAVNTIVSQSVPHCHFHIVPRWKDDKLFSPKLVWKRRPYASEAAAEETARKIREAMKSPGLLPHAQHD